MMGCKRGDYGGLKATAKAFCITLVTMIIAGCGDDKKTTLDLTIDPETTPTMLTHNVSTLISDSGITRYHITAPVWYVFSEATSPRWTFPKGVFLEKFDDDLRQEATVECDSATYFENRQLWRLDGNVTIRNVQNERFLTEQLFWDQRQQKVYSDSFIHIERQDRVIEGYGFTSDDRLTDYVVNRVSGVFPVSQFTGDHEPSPAKNTNGGISSLNRENDSDSSVNPSSSENDAPLSLDSVSSPGRHALKMRRQRQRQHSDSTEVYSAY